jgi:hypothetical protein
MLEPKRKVRVKVEYKAEYSDPIRVMAFERPDFSCLA